MFLLIEKFLQILAIQKSVTPSVVPFFFSPRLDSIFTSSVGTWGPSQCGKRPAVAWRRYNSDTKLKTPTRKNMKHGRISVEVLVVVLVEVLVVSAGGSAC